MEEIARRKALIELGRQLLGTQLSHSAIVARLEQRLAHANQQLEVALIDWDACGRECLKWKGKNAEFRSRVQSAQAGLSCIKSLMGHLVGELCCADEVPHVLASVPVEDAQGEG